MHRAEEVDGPCLLRHLSGVHDDHAVRSAGDHAHVVGDQDDCHPEPLSQGVKQVEDLRLDRHVEGRRRLVGDEQGRLADQGHGDHHPLAKAARELMGILIEPLGGSGHLDHLEDFERSGSRLRC